MSSLKFGEINKNKTKKKYLGILTYGKNTKLSDGTTLQFNHDNKYFSSVDIINGELVIKNNNGDTIYSLEMPVSLSELKTIEGNPVILQDTTISHNTSGATKGDYGYKYAQSPPFGDSFKVPFIQVDEYGHINYINTHDVSIPNTTDIETRISNIENSIGQISSMLDSINGEVI